MKPKVIAQQGASRFLVHTGGRLLSNDAVGQVVDVSNKEIFPVSYIQSTLARGYWGDPSNARSSETAVSLVKEYGSFAVGDSYIVLD